MLLNKLKAAAVVVLLLAVSTTRADEKPNAEDSKENSLTVTIKLQTNIIGNNVPFTAQLSVVNSSKSTQSFRVMNCSWNEHWKSSNKQVYWLEWECTKNFEVTESLKPGEAYERSLSMLLVTEKPQARVSFKMGFTPAGSKQTYWSNEVTLRVEPNDASKEDVAKLQGIWTAVAIERDGKSMSEEEVKKLDIRMTFKGGEFMLMPFASIGPEHFPNGTFRLYSTSNPKAIDMTLNLPFNVFKKTSAVLGIYELDGDRLKLLRGRPDQERPTEFKTMPKSDLEIIVFKRAKQ